MGIANIHLRLYTIRGFLWCLLILRQVGLFILIKLGLQEKLSFIPSEILLNSD